jgi:hypothetical protein
MIFLAVLFLCSFPAATANSPALLQQALQSLPLDQRKKTIAAAGKAVVNYSKSLLSQKGKPVHSWSSGLVRPHPYYVLISLHQRQHLDVDQAARDLAAMMGSDPVASLLYAAEDANLAPAKKKVRLRARLLGLICCFLVEI